MQVYYKYSKEYTDILISKEVRKELYSRLNKLNSLIKPIMPLESISITYIWVGILVLVFSLTMRVINSDILFIIFVSVLIIIFLSILFLLITNNRRIERVTKEIDIINSYLIMTDSGLLSSLPSITGVSSIESYRNLINLYNFSYKYELISVIDNYAYFKCNYPDDLLFVKIDDLKYKHHDLNEDILSLEGLDIVLYRKDS